MINNNSNITDKYPYNIYFNNIDTYYPKLSVVFLIIKGLGTIRERPASVEEDN